MPTFDTRYSLLLTILLLPLLAACGNTEDPRLYSSWTDDLNRGSIQFNADKTITWFGESGTFTHSQRSSMNLAAGDDGTMTVDLPSGNRFFGYDFWSDESILTLTEMVNDVATIYYFTKAGESVTPPSGWSYAMDGLETLPTVTNMLATTNRTIIVAENAHYDPAEQSRDGRKFIYLSNGDAWEQVPLQDMTSTTFPGFMGFQLAVSGDTIAVMTSFSEFFVSTDEGHTWATRTPSNPPWDVCQDGNNLSRATLSAIGADLYLTNVRRGGATIDCNGPQEGESIDLYRLENFAASSNGSWQKVETFAQTGYGETGVYPSGDSLIFWRSGAAYRSTDNAQTWEAVSTGLPSDFYPKFFSHGDSLVARNYRDAYILHSGSDTWEAISADGFEIGCSSGDDLYGVKNQQLFKTNDYGQTLTAVGERFTHKRRQYPRAFCGQGGSIYASASLLFRLTAP